MLQQDLVFHNKGYKTIAGVDEAGRGPLAGPVVSAAVCLLKTDFDCLIADSKLLSDRQRKHAYNEILEKAHIGVGIVAEDQIDLDNIHKATLHSMSKAINNLPLKPDCIIIDGLHIPNLNFKVPCIPIVNGDSKSCVIACASIVAKVTRDWIMEQYDRSFPSYGFLKHKGYGTPSHISAIKNFGPSCIHRKTFTYNTNAINELTLNSKQDNR